ncbi:ribonuclease P protein component [Candidatus Nesciobacter abundans]|nr:ribonuclease P protein component [Candidatus Nesciobacter abundans]
MKKSKGFFTDIFSIRYRKNSNIPNINTQNLKHNSCNSAEDKNMSCYGVLERNSLLDSNIDLNLDNTCKDFGNHNLDSLMPCDFNNINSNLQIKEYVQIGIIVKKKIGKAHSRNKIKRRIKSALDEIFNSNELEKTEQIILFLVKKEIVQSTYQEIKSEIEKFFLTRKIIKVNQ